MYNVQYMKSDGRVHVVSNGKIAELEGHEIAEVANFPRAKKDKEMYFIDGQIVYKPIEE